VNRADGSAGTRRRSPWSRAAAFGSGLAIVLASIVSLAPPAFAASATISFSPTSGQSGSPIVFTGTGWLPYDNVTVQLQGTFTGNVCSITADSTGAIGPKSCVVPPGLPAGTFTVKAFDSSSNSATASGTFAVQPAVKALYLPQTGTPTPTTQVAVGQTVGLSGTDFAPNSLISATFNGSPLPLTGFPSPVTTGSVGAFSNVTFTVPSVGSPGPATLLVTDGSSNTTTYIFTVYQATITHSPSGAASGGPVTIAGSGWPANDSMSLDLTSLVASAKMVSATPSPVHTPGTKGMSPAATTTPPPCIVTSDSTGTIDPTTCFVETWVPGGPYTLNATDNFLSVNDATTFVVLPSITMYGAANTPTNTAAIGQQIGISGSGFVPTSSISVTFAGQSVPLTTAVTTDGSGSFTGATIVVPSVALGPELVKVFDGSPNPAAANINVFAPTIVTSAPSGASGQPLSFSGAGWPGDDSLSVRMVSSTGTATNVCTVTTEAAGGIISKSCTVPTGIPYGVYTVNATDTFLSVNSTTQFTLKPGIIVYGANGQRTATAAPGQVVGISGSGFAANSTVSTTFGGSTVALAPTPTPTVSASGSTPTPTPTFTIPTSAVPGFAQVAMIDASSNVATFRLSIYRATINASSYAGGAGKQMTFSGNGWPINDAVTLKLGTTAVCTVNADTSGVITPQSCALPTSVPFGPYLLTASDGSILVNAPSTFTMEPTVTLLSQTLTSAYSQTVSAAVGQVVYVSAAGFAPNSALSVSFAGQPVGWTTQPVTNTSGSYTPSGTTGAGFAIQPVAPGLYSVSVSDSLGDTATYQLRVFFASAASAISHTPTNGVAGHQLSFSGSGWPGNDTISIRLVLGNTSPLNWSTLCTITSDPTGNVVPQSCPIPSNLAAGTYSVYAADASISVYDPTSFKMNPSLYVCDTTCPLTPASSAPPGMGVRISTAAIGQQVSVAGTGWAQGTSLTATFGGNPISGGLSPVPAINTVGQFSGTGFTIPNVTPGPVTLSIHDNNSLTATYVLHVYAATIGFSPSATAAGKNLVLSGSGWPASDTINLKLVQVVSGSATPATAALCSVTTDTTGTLVSQTCAVPTTLPAGAYNVVASDGGIVISAPSQFTLQPAAAIENSAGTPIASAVHGSTAYVMVWGFAANSHITSMTFGSSAVATTPASPATNASGTLASKASFIVPSLTAGTYTVTVTDAASNTATVQFSIS
jgi:hypothetical protein